MSGHPQGQYDDGYGHQGQGNDAYYQDGGHDQGYAEEGYDYNQQHQHGGEGYYDESYVTVKSVIETS